MPEASPHVTHASGTGEGALRGEMTRLLYTAFPLPLATSVIIALLLGGALWLIVGHASLYAWLSLLFLVTALRVWLLLKYRHAPAADKLKAGWGQLFTLGTALAGASWGASMFLIYPEQSPQHQIFLAFVIAGICAGGVASLAYHWQTYASFVLLAVLPVTLRFAFSGQLVLQVVAIMSLFFIAALLLSAWRISHNTRLNIELKQDAVRHENALIAAKEEAERASRAKSEFLSKMSHDLRTPLNAVIGFAYLIKEEITLSADQREMANEIHTAGQHLLALVNDILDLARIESGRIRIELQPIEVLSALQECLRIVQPLANKHHVTIDGAEGCKAMWVMADPVRLKQVLCNLLSNAIKYNRKDGKVHVGCSHLCKDSISIAVSDTGRGIANDRIPHLFKPFSRLESDTGAIEGTGIGLSITSQLLEAMHGDMQVQSTPGQGSTFTVTFPAAAPPVPQQPSGTTPAQSHSPAAAALAGKKLLLIDDSALNQNLVNAIMTAKMPQIATFITGSAEEGLSMIEQHLPDAILLDINLPGMDGYEMLKRLRANQHTRHIPVIAFTADAMRGDMERGKKAGFFDYITKPINLTSFLRIIQSALTKSLTKAVDNTSDRL